MRPLRIAICNALAVDTHELNHGRFNETPRNSARDVSLARVATCNAVLHEVS
jgi:hypothetical protein